MHPKLFFLSLFLIISSSLFAQQGRIKGRIVGPGNDPLFGITIRLEPGKTGTRTDDLGNFQFSVPSPGNYTLVATGVGYQAKSSEVRISPGATVTLTLELNTAASVLREVAVTAARPASANTLTRLDVASRDVPQNIQKVSRTLIADQQLFQLDEIFKNVAGITSADYYGGFSSRGYTSGKSGITINGINGNPYPEGQLPLLGNIEAVEVIHGPNAIIFGPGGMGGNINLVTKQPKKYKGVNASLTGGSRNLFRAQADVSGSLTKKQNLYLIAGTAYQNGGSFTRDFDRLNLQVYGAVKWEISPKTSWQVNATYLNDKVSNNYQPRVPVYNTFNADSIFMVHYDFNPGMDSRYRGNNIQVQSLTEHHFSDDWKLGVLLAYNESRADRRQYTASGFVNPVTNTVARSYTWQKIHSPQTTLNLYGVGKVSTFGLKHHFSAGADAYLARNNYPDGILQYEATPLHVYHPEYEARFDSTGMRLYTNSAREKFRYNTLGAYVLDQIEIMPKLKALLGLRYNNYFRRYYAVKRDGTVMYDEKPERTENFSPRLGLVYQPVTGVSFYADYNEGFSPQYSNYTEYGGPFDPETSRQFELGIKGDFLKGSLFPFISLYHSTKKNVLQTVPKEGAPYWLEAIGEVQSRGIEMGISGTAFPNLFVNFNYNYNKTKITGSRKPEEIGQLFANSPENTANGFLRYSLKRGRLNGLFFGGGFQYVDKRYFRNKKVGDKAQEMPAYTVFDALIGYMYRYFTLQVNGNNLLDKRYASSGGYAAYTPGMPRNIMVTLSCSIR